MWDIQNLQRVNVTQAQTIGIHTGFLIHHALLQLPEDIQVWDMGTELKLKKEFMASTIMCPGQSYVHSGS